MTGSRFLIGQAKQSCFATTFDGNAQALSNSKGSYNIRREGAFISLILREPHYLSCLIGEKLSKLGHFCKDFIRTDCLSIAIRFSFLETSDWPAPGSYNKVKTAEQGEYGKNCESVYWWKGKQSFIYIVTKVNQLKDNHPCQETVNIYKIHKIFLCS